MSEQPKFLSPDDLAARWGVSRAALALWRCKGKGPKFFKMPGGRMVRYALEDIEAYERTMKPVEEKETNEL